jgi:hypothetical protein
MLHTIRQIVNDDKKMESILKEFSTSSNGNYKQIEDYLSTAVRIDLQTVL